MLYWLKHPVVGAPPGVSFGLTYLLAFVFGSIPAAIGAGALYGVSLADSDWLHGAAEALLTITNVIVVLGFRAEDRGDDPFFSAYKLRETATFLGWFIGLSALAVAATGAGVHTQFLFGLGNLPTAVWPAEPLNALSIPTWIIHTSSLIEWLVAMGLAWRYADLSGTPEWKGVTWGMLPLHTSGIVAVTYHLFYNAPALTWLVVLQAAMTCLGNTTLAFAMYRLACASGWTWQMARDDTAALLFSFSEELAYAISGDEEPLDVRATGGRWREGRPDRPPPLPEPLEENEVIDSLIGERVLTGYEDLGDIWARDTDSMFLVKLFALSGGLAYFVKYLPGLLKADAWYLPDQALSSAAIFFICVPTALNCAKWYQRSQEDAEFIGDF
jgi:hypothetical protein